MDVLQVQDGQSFHLYMYFTLYERNSFGVRVFDYLSYRRSIHDAGRELLNYVFQEVNYDHC
jgi:hypothetical protein